MSDTSRITPSVLAGGVDRPARPVEAATTGSCGSPAATAHAETQKTHLRPWGGFCCLLRGTQFQVKRLFVRPAQSLSLQWHRHRSEHWVVVRGVAAVRIGNTVSTLNAGESAYIRKGELHRLANPGTAPLELIEVQIGAYLGEDDIVRVEDDYGRI